MNGWTIWITGLPGSGKTVRAKELLKKLEQKNMKVEYLRMDAIRKILTPKRKYTEEERDYAYRALVLLGKSLTESGINVVIDATGHRKVWRELATILMKPPYFMIFIMLPLSLKVPRTTP